MKTFSRQHPRSLGGDVSGELDLTVTALCKLQDLCDKYVKMLGIIMVFAKPEMTS